MKLRETTKRLTYTAISIAMMILLAQISIPLGPVPLTLGMLGIFLISGILGPVYGTIAVGIYIAMGALGLPVFVGFKGGLSAIAGPTGGFIIGYIFVPIITGIICNLFKYKYIPMTIGYILGLFVCYTFGAIWYMNFAAVTFGKAMMVCVVPFIVPDLLKIVIAELLVVRLRKLLRIHTIFSFKKNVVINAIEPPAISGQECSDAATNNPATIDSTDATDNDKMNIVK